MSANTRPAPIRASALPAEGSRHRMSETTGVGTFTELDKPAPANW
ncbi:hypothetical protein [Nocardia gipuzkoensis]|nr:hypothetical protein [Nocardia gipuzkoensis]